MLNLKQGALSLASAKRTNSVEVQNVVETLSSDEEGRRFTNGSHRLVKRTRASTKTRSMISFCSGEEGTSGCRRQGWSEVVTANRDCRSYEFGPCIRMTRLERWERAEALGLLWKYVRIAFCLRRYQHVFRFGIFCLPRRVSRK
ncbi:hypothetical protein V8E55_007248 [Tylopilus felleus]